MVIVVGDQEGIYSLKVQGVRLDRMHKEGQLDVFLTGVTAVSRQLIRTLEDAGAHTNPVIEHCHELRSIPIIGLI